MAFVPEFVLELGNERPCNARKSHIASVDTNALAQCLRLPLIAPSLSPHAILAIVESLGFTSSGIAITRSFGLIPETAKKRPASFRSETATINRCKLSQPLEKRLKSNDIKGGKISCRRSGINRCFAIIALPTLKRPRSNGNAPIRLPASARRSPVGAIISVTSVSTRSQHRRLRVTSTSV